MHVYCCSEGQGICLNAVFSTDCVQHAMLGTAGGGSVRRCSRLLTIAPELHSGAVVLAAWLMMVVTKLFKGGPSSCGLGDTNKHVKQTRAASQATHQICDMHCRARGVAVATHVCNQPTHHMVYTTSPPKGAAWLHAALVDTAGLWHTQ